MLSIISMVKSSIKKTIIIFRISNRKHGLQTGQILISISIAPFIFFMIHQLKFLITLLLSIFLMIEIDISVKLYAVIFSESRQFSEFAGGQIIISLFASSFLHFSLLMTI